MNGKAPTVLIVDPDPDVLMSTALLVEALGYAVITLADAPDVLDVVERKKPDLILQEVQMAGLNISGLMASLRAHEATAKIPVVFFSAAMDLPAIAARHNAWGHVGKPFGAQEFARILERALGPPPGRHSFDASKDVEKEIRLAFREYRNLLAAFNNYVVVLEKAEELSPHTRSSVERLQDLVLMLEARTVRLRAYILALVGPAEQITGGSRQPRPANPERLSSRPKPAEGPGARPRKERLVGS